MFEKAVRKKLRFETKVGDVTVEDLWDMELVNETGFSLDALAIDLSRQLKERVEESFVVKKANANTILNLKFEIVKYIIEVKLEEQKIAENRVLAKAKKEKILEIMARKKDAVLEESSLEELEQMIEEL